MPTGVFDAAIQIFDQALEGQLYMATHMSSFQNYSRTAVGRVCHLVRWG
jgi:hypothetical protein